MSSRQFFKIGADVSLVSPVAAATASTPLPPSVEEAYRRKCIDLKKRMSEVEDSNDAFRQRKVRLNRGIRKMRLERAYLLEMLGKRMKKNGASYDGLAAVYDEESEGSSEGPPTPHDRPLRSKRGHRRPLSSPPPAPQQQIEYSQQQRGYHHGPYDQPSNHQHESPYGPSAPAPNGVAQSSQAQAIPMQQPTLQSSNQAVPSSAYQPAHNPMLSPIPAPEPFAMFFENNYLSQPHKHSGARTEPDLLDLAQAHWEAPEYATQRKLYEAQARKQRKIYEESNQSFELAAQQQQPAQAHGRTIQPKVDHDEAERRPTSSRGGRHAAREEAALQAGAGHEREDVEMGEAGSGGFTSINK